MINIFEFNKEMNDWNYGVLIDGKVVKDLDNVNWARYRTTPVNILSKYRVGICWDFVNYQHHVFTQNNIKNKSYFFVCGDGDDIVTHTFSVVESLNRPYWFESSWVPHQGIHQIKDVRDVVSKLIHRYGEKDWELYEYNPYGMDKNLSNSEFFKKATKHIIMKG